MPAKFQAPSGTRDMYPAELLRRRYIEKLWRDTSIRHGFEEIDGPTFEHADLYAVKSGEGILNELFQVFSGKDAGELDAIRAGKSAPYALRPEFTPTLARMYAAKAGALPKPTKWFWMQNCYRAERQQRGRLREFGQWNCDILGTENEPEAQARADAELAQVTIGLLLAGGLKRGDTHVALSHRKWAAELVRLSLYDKTPANIEASLALLDTRSKLSADALSQRANAISFELETFDENERRIKAAVKGEGREKLRSHSRVRAERGSDYCEPYEVDFDEIAALFASIEVDEGPDASSRSWCRFDPGIVRGLAYYTGMVFEVIAEGERAIAGGGRYDNLIELFGGPATPAVGFGMGDVVLSLVLQDRGLLPEGDALMDALSRPSASYRPDVFVIPAGQTESDQAASAAQVRPLVARLRRGTESDAYQSRESRKPWDADRYDAASNGVPPLHARHSYKSTKNIGKLLEDAVKQKAKLAVIIESAEDATIKDLRTGKQEPNRVKLTDVPREVAKRL